MDGKKTFGPRVGNYVKYRPSYPAQAIDYLFSEVGFGSGSIIADVGCGTGIFSRCLIGRVRKIYGVEPNAPMREAAGEGLEEYSGFVPVDGTAENTSLPDQSVDFVTAAQAFHWFDRGACKQEFRRILRPGGLVALIWNRRLEDPGFHLDYRHILEKHAEDAREVGHEKISREEFGQFFEGGYREAVFSNSQWMDFENLLGRTLSSSYAPLDGEKNAALQRDLGELFSKYSVDGKIEFGYATRVYFGAV